MKEADLETSATAEKRLHLIVLNVHLAVIEKGEDFFQNAWVHLNPEPEAVRVLEVVREQIEYHLMDGELAVAAFDVEIAALAPNEQLSESIQ